MQDTADGQADEPVNRSHPFAVARGQVVVHRDDVHAAAGQRVQVNRQRRHQRLAFAGGHFRDSPAVQRVAANELHVEGDHLPFQRMSANHNLLAAQPAACVFDDREGLGKDFPQPPGQRLVVLDPGQFRLPRRRPFPQSVVRH